MADGSGGGRGLRWLHLVVPGLTGLRSGRPLEGVLLLALWGASWGILVWRRDRILAAPDAGLEGWLALGTLLLMGLGSLLWSPAWREWHRRREGMGRGPWASALRTFRRNRVAVAGAIAVAALALVALLAPFLAPYPPAFQGDLLTRRLVGPSTQHLLGTDPFARDILSRLIYGTRVSLSIALLAVSIAVTIGTLLGAVAGYVGGKVDALIMRGVDLVLAFPRLVLLITVMALFRPGFTLIVLILGLTQWPLVARIVRGEVLSLREREFVLAGRALGFSRGRIIVRHVVPNVMAPVIVAGTLGVGDTIVLEAILSFLGLGVQEPMASWGRMVSGGREHLLGAWWVAAFPGGAIVLAVLAFNLAGDGLRDALDPRLRG